MFLTKKNFFVKLNTKISENKSNKKKLENLITNTIYKFNLLNQLIIQIINSNNLNQ